MPEIHFIDTTLRDGSLSLWASQLSTSMMLSVIEDIDAAGYDSIEFGQGPRVRAVQVLNEDPTAWLRLGPPRVKHTQLLYHGGSLGTDTSGRSVGTTPRCIVELSIRMAVEKGLTITRTSDSWNNFDRAGMGVRAMEKAGMRTVSNLIYSISPIHTDEYYARKAVEIAAIKPYRICFKDVDGILTPERTRTILPMILGAAGDIPVEFHAHSCTGMAASCILAAAECGVRYIHTGIPPLADGTAQPSIFTAVRNLKEMGFDTAIDLDAVRRASDKLMTIAHREQLPIGTPPELDYRQYLHQIPGGMTSALLFQLKQVGMEEKLPDVLAETARVRAEFGYPIMVTPLSQFVGSQAAINVITGQRYVSVTDEAIRYAQGFYGEEAIVQMDPDVRQFILNRERADQLAKVDEERDDHEETLDEVRERYGGGVTDEQLVYLPVCGIRALPLMRNEKEVTSYNFNTSPEARWLRDLPKNEVSRRVIDVQRDGLSLRVGFK